MFYVNIVHIISCKQAIHNVNKNTHIKWDNVESGKDRRHERRKKLRFGYNTRINSK